MPDIPAISDTSDQVTRSGARLSAAIDPLTDADVRAPSTLPGWTRGHVITHLTQAVDAYLWLLAVAHTGAEPTPRTGREVLAAELQQGAGRPAAELAAALRGRLTQLREAAALMPAEAWDTPVTALAGWQHPASYTLYRCLREFETHHFDLDIGYRTTDWPAGYLAWALDDTLAALRARGFAVSSVEAVDLGRTWTISPTGPTVSGPAHALLGWLSGRTPATLLTTDRPLPSPPTWPLPLAPAR